MAAGYTLSDKNSLSDRGNIGEMGLCVRKISGEFPEVS
jgi:hypothetical protein